MKYKDVHSDVGQLKQRLELQAYTETSDGMGGTTATWAEVDTVWGNMKPVTGTEQWEIESLKGTISHVVTIRYRDDITSENRFVYDGRIFLIQYAINKGEEDVYMKLAVTEDPDAES